MTIPQVNAGATDRNREQTRRICELKGVEYCAFKENAGRVYARWEGFEDGYPHRRVIVEDLPNGSFTPDQVWGILERECVGWHWAGEDDANNNEGGAAFPKSGWYKEWEDDLEDALIIETNNPHDLTAAMDALIKVLETKGEKV